MEEYFMAMPIGNSSVLCVGSITQRETQLAKDCGMGIDGYGYYLFLASHANPAEPIEILAKFATEAAAEKLARLFGRRMIAESLAT